ncbi:MAG: type II secretion system F family protein, partial [Marinicaulis sp.]|nr:type II secretion system F family protein [Marinicaulis sp.]
MPAFEYEALDPSGKACRGIVNADSQRQARRELRQRNLTPVEMSAPRSEKASGAFQREPRLSGGELVNMTRQLSALIGAATPLEEALQAVAMQTDKPGARTRLLSVRERVTEGWRFADALGEDPKSFPSLYRAVIAAGETSGDLGGVLDRLATMLEKNRAMKNKAIASLIYPLVLALFAGGVLTSLMIFVVPRIVEQFNSFDAQLPFLTQVVVGISNGVANYGLYVLLALVIGGVALWRALKVPSIKLVFDQWVLKLPIFGRLARAVDGARFARTLATLFAGGAP